MTDTDTKTAAIIVIGDEILSGRTLDTNVQTIAQMLGSKGIAVAEVRIIPDVVPTIVETVNTMRARVDYVFTTGGIGPTHDDRTTEAVAAAFGVAATRHADAWARLVAHYDGEANINEGRAKMAVIPDGATLIDNPVSSAPGYRIGNVHVLAGVPKIMQAMLEGVLPTLEGGAVIHSRSVMAAVAESVIAKDLAAIEAAHAGLSVGSYPKFTPAMKPSTTIVVRGTDYVAVKTAVAQVAEAMRRAGAEPMFI